MNNMKKSQLVALLEHFRKDITEITREEFYTVFEAEKNTDTVISFVDTSNSDTECMAIFTDGMAYKRYASIYSVGWEGDHDSDEFYMKVETITKQEMEDILSLFTNDAKLSAYETTLGQAE